MATVHLDGMLRQFVSTRSVELDADDVSGLIDRIEETYLACGTGCGTRPGSSGGTFGSS